MKKQFLYCLLFLLNLIAVPTFAQGIMVGLKAGPTFNTFHHSQDVNFTSRPGFELGGSFEAATNELFSLVVELNYAMYYGEAESTDLSLGYFEVPVLFRFATGKKTRWFANVGLQTGILTHAKEKGPTYISDGTFDPIVIDESTTRYVNRYYEESNVSAVIGGGVLIQNLTLEARYYAGLTNASRQNTVDLSATRFSFTVGYALVF